MNTPAIDENLRFLLVEVRKQVEHTKRFLAAPAGGTSEPVAARDDYIDNLKNRIQRACFAAAAGAARDDPAAVARLESIEIVTVNLERIADFCESIAAQVGYLEDLSVLSGRDFSPVADEVLAALATTEKAVFESRIDLALSICRAEHNLDRLYAEAFADVLAGLSAGGAPQPLVTLLLIYHYFERMGDSLLNVGEAVISATLGERIKIDQFHALERSLGVDDGDGDLGDLSIRAIGGSRSGCRIDRVERKEGDNGRSVIFKEGRRQKLIEEKEGIERWQDAAPGLVPSVYAFHDHGDGAALLFEYLPGRTLEQLVVGEDAAVVGRAFDALCATVEDVWSRTRVHEPARAGFLGQLSKRLADVYAVHPTFRVSSGSIGGIRTESLERLIQRASTLETNLVAPFQVLIHGDFNIDNILYDTETGAVHFIDVHRSRRADYVQDVSVFLVSNFRLQAFRTPIRRRLERLAIGFAQFGAGFAARSGDGTYAARLAFGLARSFATSTRFVLDEEFARSMLLRSRFLLERLARHPASEPETFELPLEVLGG